MLIETDFRDYLSSLNTTAEDRVFILHMPQGEVYPAITFSLAAKDRLYSQAGLTGSEYSTFHVQCSTKGTNFQQQYIDAKNLVNSIVTSINSYSSEISGVYAIRVNNEVDEQIYLLDGNQGCIQTITLELTVYKG